MEFDIFKIDGASTGNKVKLPKHVFGIEPSENAVYLAVKHYNANQRQGNAATKTRSLVRGGGRKPWKQKGRGSARAGSTSSPVWVGGGRVFGPAPRDYNTKLPKKVKSLAKLSVYSDKAKNDKIKLVEDFKLTAPRTKELHSILKSLGVDGQKNLLLIPDYDSDILLAGRNIPKLSIKVASTESTYDLLKCDNLLIQQGAVDKLSGVFKK